VRLFGYEIARVRAQTLQGVSPTGGGGWYGLIRESFGGAWQRGVSVDAPRDILSFPGVFAPFTLIASDIAKMRLKLVQEDDNGICEEVKDGSPFLKVLQKPNHYQNRIKFIEQWIVSKLLYGNTYALKQREGRTMVDKLYILDAQRVKPLVAESGDVFYELSADHLSGIPATVTVPASEIIQDSMVSLWHPLVGVSPNYGAGHSATMGNRIQRNSTKFFDNMSRPSGSLTSPGKISDELAARLKQEWDANFSGGNLGRTAVLGEGLKYEAMTIPAQQAQLIEQLKISGEQIAACYHMPLFKIGGPIPIGSTIDALQQIYYSDCLQSFIESFELCMDEGLELKPGYHVEFDLDGLLRMDSAALIASEAEAVKGGIKAPNESRKRLNLPPMDGGDSIYMQQQWFSLEALAKRDALPNPFVIDRPTPNPTPSSDGAATTADPSAPAANDAKAAAETAALIAYITEGLACAQK
jgi:HK97 family phage portal protein